MSAGPSFQRILWLVREGTREGVVVGHPGRGNMVDVRFRDVTFVERRDAERLSVRPEYEAGEEQLRSVTEGVYESLVKRELGVKTFKDRKGARADVKALDKGTITREQLSALYGRARAIAVSQGRKYGDLTTGSLARTGERMLPTATGRALSALRYGADPRLVERQLRASGASDTAIKRVLRLGQDKTPEEMEENRQDYEVTLSLLRTKTGKYRYTVERRGRGVVYVLQPGGKEYKTERGAKAAVERLNAAEAPKPKRRPAPKARSNPRYPMRRNYAAILGAAGRGAAAAGRGIRTAGAYLAPIKEWAIVFINSPAGQQAVAGIVVMATSVLGAKAVASGNISAEQAALVSTAIQQELGKKVDSEVVRAAVAAQGAKA